MKNSKFIKAVAAITLSAVSAVACFGSAGCAHKHTWGEYTPDGDGGHYRVCSGCDERETVSAHEYDANYKCGVCGYQHTHKFADGWTTDNYAHWHASTCGHSDEISSYANHDKSTCSQCGYSPVATEADDINDDPNVATFENETVTAAPVDAPKVTPKTGNGAALETGKIVSDYEFDAADFDVKTYTDGWTDGIFSITAGTEVRGRIKTNTIYDGNTATDIVYETKNSVKLGDDNAALSIKTSSAGTLVFYVLNGSSGATGTQALTITKPSGSSVATNVTYPANGNSSNIQLVTLNLDVAGTYTIKRASGTSDIYYAKFTTEVDNTPIESISVAGAGKTEYLVGQQLDCTGIAVTATHADTGRISPVDVTNLDIDTSAYNPAVAGEYTIGVSYTLDGNLSSSTTTFTTSYKVKVYAFEDFALGFNKIVKESKNSAAGNGVYFNHAVKQFYFKGDAFSFDGLSITVTGKLGTETKKFLIDESQAEITNNDTSAVGKKTVKVAYTAGTVKMAKGFNIYVAERGSELATADEVMLAVNSGFSTATIGTKNSKGAYRFKTVQQALDFINAANIKASAEKIIYIAEGTYWEKLEVTVPNVTLVGAGQDKTKIEYDSLYGVADEGGFVHTTDSTATLNVRDTAVGFKMRHLTVSNKYNTLASYSGAASNDKRALAMLVQADKVIIDNCTLLGFQDTLELFTGRQLFTNCLISGSVDFIFGTNNTTYFYKCEIKVIANGSNGGYVTAFKGLNKGHGTDEVKYGAVFDDCDFTAESGVPDGKSAIGRAWGADAAVMVMNSRLGKHISKSASTNAGGRYISMGQGDPAKAQFTEYNNTGDGAVTSLTVGKVLAQAEAADYNNFAVIFGTANGRVTYKDIWDITV